MVDDAKKLEAIFQLIDKEYKALRRNPCAHAIAAQMEYVRRKVKEIMEGQQCG